jgi:hypothetical protein
MSIYSLTFDRRVWWKSWKTTVRIPLHSVYICTSHLLGKKQGCQQIDLKLRFPFTFDTEWEGLQFFSLCSQLTASASVNANQKQFQENVKSRAVEVQTQSINTTETVQNAARCACENITQQIQAATKSVQQQATNIDSSSQQVQACLIQHAQQCAVISETSRK